MGPPPALAQVRLAVRRALAALALDDPVADGPATVLVACSGGPDSTALAAALAFEARSAGVRAGAVTVDHGLQPGSAAQARAVAARLACMPLDPVEVVHVRVDGREGPEGAARTARYAALDAAATRHRAAVLLGHTRDDQAETVLLGLARGSGARSLAGMAARTRRGAVAYLRPLLDLPRDVVDAAAGDEVWHDPHNDDPAYARSRVRTRLLPALEAELGPGVAAALARTAALLRDDADALDVWAQRCHEQVMRDHQPGELDAIALSALPTAVRRRVLRRAALAVGSPATDLTAAHVVAVDALVMVWTGQLGVDLPGRVRAQRAGAVLRLTRAGAGR